MPTFIESVVEEADLAWLESLGWSVMHGPAIAPGEPGAERADYALVVTEAFERVAAPQLTRTLASRRESRTLSALRDTLLPKLISGELRVTGKPEPEKNPPTNLANSRRPN